MLADINVLLLDIEGTITDIAFVRNVLFPYVRNHLREYIEKRWDSPEMKGDIEALRVLSKLEFENGDKKIVPFPVLSDQSPEHTLNALMANVNHWMDLDKKLGPLKQLQGHMWRDAYQNGEIKGHLYPDVVPALLLITQNHPKIKIYIYSSGSVLAQKLLFSNSCEGDVTNLFSGYFDTAIGAKTEASSYERIADTIATERGRILFLTDVEREAYPARRSGLKVGLMVRDGNEPVSEKAKVDFPIYKSLEEIM